MESPQPPQSSPAGPREAQAGPANWQVARIWGIPIGLHWSMAFVFGLLALSLAMAYFPETDPTLSTATAWVLGIITALLFFTSILLHELGHSRIALHNGIPVESITLFIFGGIARIAGRPKTAGVELAIAIAGPVVSFVLAGLFGAIWWLADDITALAAAAGWLARLNLILALFNLLPGFPLDGGRILRALVWQFTGNEQRATQVSLVSGQMLAFGLMGIGALLAFNGNFANGIWLIFIGWFLQNAAVSEATGSKVEIALRGATVRQAMGPRETEIPSRTKVRQLIDEHILATGHRYFLVVDGDVPRGVVTLRDLAAVPQDRWDWTSVGDIMTPWARLTIVTPETDLLEALQVMDDARVSSLPVMDGERLCGLLTREEVLHYVRLRMELQGATA